MICCIYTHICIYASKPNTELIDISALRTVIWLYTRATYNKPSYFRARMYKNNTDSIHAGFESSRFMLLNTDKLKAYIINRYQETWFSHAAVFVYKWKSDLKKFRRREEKLLPQSLTSLVTRSSRGWRPPHRYSYIYISVYMRGAALLYIHHQESPRGWSLYENVNHPRAKEFVASYDRISNARMCVYTIVVSLYWPLPANIVGTQLILNGMFSHSMYLSRVTVWSNKWL